MCSMDGDNKATGKPNPYLTANPFSKLLFSWIGSLLSLANKEKKLPVQELYNVLPEDESGYLGDKLDREWSKELQKTKLGKKPSLTRALIRTYGLTYMFFGMLSVVEESFRIIQPIFLGRLIDYFSPMAPTSELEAYLYAGAVTLCSLGLMLVHAPVFFGNQWLGMKTRVSLCTLVYRKMLRLDSISVHKSSSGHVNNLMTNDVNRYDAAFLFMNMIWLGPLEMIIILVLLWLEIGWASLPGYLVLFLLLPVQTFFGRLFGKLRRKTAVYTDKRVRLMTEIISAIRVIKMYAWEYPFGDVIQRVRKSEISKIIQATYLIGFNLVLGAYGNRLIDCCMIVTYAIIADEIKVSTVFVVVTYCSSLKYAFMKNFPRGIQSRAECLVVNKRIQNFLLLDEILPAVSSVDTDSQNMHGIQVEKMNGSWEETMDNPTLTNVSFNVSKGELLAVVGPVGSGKSSLLMGILNELPRVSGKINVNGRIAYASQDPWVFSGTIRQNIVFGKEFEQSKYNQILKVCALDKDVKHLLNGDQTMVGERGVTLSGGQKARVNLARALYDEADIYLLDDPLSAVDSEVGRHIFDGCIMEYLANKPRILVTHQLQFLNTADKILVLKKGNMEAVGPLAELHEKGIDFASLMKQDDEDAEDDQSEEDEVDAGKGYPELRHRSMSSKSHSSTCMSVKSQVSVRDEKTSDTVKAFKDEVSKQGQVTLKVYYKYFKSGASWLMMLLLVVLLFGVQVVFILTDLWLAWWAEVEEARGRNQTMLPPDQSDDTFLDFDAELTTLEGVAVYGVFVAALLILAITRCYMFFRVMIKSSRNLHNRMFNNIIRSPLLFFDTNPIGRILNRFTKDIGIMDDQLPLAFFDFLQLSFQCLGTILLTVLVNYYIIILVVPLTIVFELLRRYAIIATRAIKRLEGITRSPVFSHVTASFQGLCTIRAFKREHQFHEAFNRHQDKHSQAWFAYIAVNRWFGVRLSLIIVIFTAGIAFGSVPLVQSLDAGLVALILSNSIVLTNLFQFVVRQSALVENQMTSVERVIEYTKLEPEAPLTNPKAKPPPAWPQFGALTLNKMSLSYSPEGPLVLKDVNCSIAAKEKVGIVGRTGAGKSSIITALFRLAEPKGSVIMDGVTTSELGLHDLRQKLSIIPQDPVLFSGSLRYNLDPFSQQSDIDLWNALLDVQLHNVVQESVGKLDMEVGESGSNFSIGQRQLICLARAVLRQNRVLIMDEATANVDPRTDALIQETIRNKFQNCTVLTIAHRLNTIMDSDRIMVLENGQLIEFDQPHNLLSRPGSMLNNLVEQTGKTKAAELIEIARSHFKQRRVTGIVTNGAIASPEELTVDGYNQHIRQWGRTDSMQDSGKSTESKGVQTEYSEYHAVNLPKTAEGFGFSVAGSSDNPHMPLIVVQVVEGSLASLPYALKVGDEIVTINGQERSQLTYAEVCQMIKDSKDHVRLLIKRHYNTTNKAVKQPSEDGSRATEVSPATRHENETSPSGEEPLMGDSTQSSGRSSMAFANEGFEAADERDDVRKGEEERISDVQLDIAASSDDESEHDTQL